MILTKQELEYTAYIKNLVPVDRFLHWIRERRQILLKRRAGQPKPWTKDPILQSFYFTNVCREDDRVSTWFRENIREPLHDDPAVVFATIAFRWFNWPETGAVLIGAGGIGHSGLLGKYGYFYEWNLGGAITALNAQRNRGRQVFTGAFNISNSGSTKPKINRVCEDYIQPVWEDREHLYSFLTHGNMPMSTAFRKLQDYPGLGGSGFMAAQVICDLAYTHVLENAPDWWTWSSWGPGSKRGMWRVMDRDTLYIQSRSAWSRKLEELRFIIKQKLGLNLHARDVQNCLCEFDKYERALWDEGHMKRKYPGR